MQIGGALEGPEIGPKGRIVVYRADQDTDDVFEVYRVDLKTGAVTKLNGPLVAGGSVVRADLKGGRPGFGF